MEQMQTHKKLEEDKRKQLNGYIEEQKKIIADKESQIKDKNEKISKMEEEYNDKL